MRNVSTLILLEEPPDRELMEVSPVHLVVPIWSGVFVSTGPGSREEREREREGEKEQFWLKDSSIFSRFSPIDVSVFAIYF